MAYQDDKELATYRNLVEQPDQFEDGFDYKTIIGAILMGLLIVPGSIYIMLVAGENVGPAARWVTIFLFAEMARRSLKDLRQQEVYILFYMTGIVLLPTLIPMTGVLWRIYMAQSEPFQAMGITQQLPSWVVPPQDVIERDGRTLFTTAWIAPLGVIFLTYVIQRLDHFGMGYFFYRVASDGERLPFPMAPIGAAGVLAMADTRETRQQGMRWRPACFAVGGVLGLLFGAIYLGVPAVTSVLLREPMFIIPIPWIELTPAFEEILPATAINFVPNMAMFILGMTLPFWAVIGGFCGFLITVVLNPILYDGGILRHTFGINYEGGVLSTWRPGMETVDTLFSNTIDFYLSFGLGITFFIALLGIGQALVPAIKRLLAGKSHVAEDGLTLWQRTFKGKEGRGDIHCFLALGIYVFSTLLYISICTYLVPGFPWYFFLLYGFVYIPLIAYASAKIEGMAGQFITIPYIKEATFILSGYKGVGIWFAPIPYYNYGQRTRGFRVCELTGTKLTSLIKTEIFTLPIIILAFIVFSSFIWAQAPLTSAQYPYVQKVWDLMAKNQALVISSTLPGTRSLFFEALNGKIILTGLLGAGALYGFLSLFGLPVLLVFGIVRGLGQTNPAFLVPEFMGAIIGRFYFQRKFGDMWRKYTPAIYAGFTCGVGLVGMISVAIRLIATSVEPLPY